MSKREFQKRVREEGGYIMSDGTCKYEHLLSSAYDLIFAYGIRNSELGNDILSVFNLEKSVFPLYNEVFYGLEIPDNKQEDAAYIWNEDVYHFFNEIAPNGYYFGSNYGDGACIGWFKIEEE